MCTEFSTLVSTLLPVPARNDPLNNRSSYGAAACALRWEKKSFVVVGRSRRRTSMVHPRGISRLPALMGGIHPPILRAARPPPPPARCARGEPAAAAFLRRNDHPTGHTGDVSVTFDVMSVISGTLFELHACADTNSSKKVAETGPTRHTHAPRVPAVSP